MAWQPPSEADFNRDWLTSKDAQVLLSDVPENHRQRWLIDHLREGLIIAVARSGRPGGDDKALAQFVPVERNLWSLWDENGPDYFWETGNAVFEKAISTGYGIERTYRFFDVRFDPATFTGRPPTETAPVEPAENPSPPPADEWLSAAETYRLATAHMPDGQARVAICSRAHSGLLRTHSVRFEKHREVFEDVELPKEFWWATGHEALHQNWITGDFETWINHNYHWKAFGVRFHRADLLKMLPAPAAPPAAIEDVVIPSGEALKAMAAVAGSAESAAKMLLEGVRVGAIRATAATYRVSGEGGPTTTARNKALDPEDWEGFEEADLKGWKSGLLDISYWDAFARNTVSVRISGLRVNRADLEELLKDLPPQSPDAREAPPNARNPGGRPQAEWWDELLLAMFRRLWEGNWTPRTQAELVDAMHQWLAENPGDDPAQPRTAGDTALKKRAKKLLAGLDLGR